MRTALAFAAEKPRAAAEAPPSEGELPLPSEGVLPSACTIRGGESDGGRGSATAAEAAASGAAASARRRRDSDSSPTPPDARGTRGQPAAAAAAADGQRELTQLEKGGVASGAVAFTPRYQAKLDQLVDLKEQDAPSFLTRIRSSHEERDVPRACTLASPSARLSRRH